MLTPESLQKRLHEWATKLNAQLPSTMNVPILLYQCIYTLLHELKTSVTLSSNVQIQTQEEIVVGLEKTFKKLAYDELELPLNENIKLLAAANGLRNLETLVSFLDANLTKATAHVTKDYDLYKQELPWDSLSKARASSAARHGYEFWSKSDACELNSLIRHHELLFQETLSLGGIPILRKLGSEETSRTNDQQVQLKYTQYAAFEPTEPIATTLKSKGWNTFKASV